MGWDFAHCSTLKISGRGDRSGRMPALLRVYNCLVIYTNIPARDPGHCPRAGFNAFWLHLKQHDHWVSGIIIYLLCNELLHAWNNWFKLIKRYKKEYPWLWFRGKPSQCYYITARCNCILLNPCSLIVCWKLMIWCKDWILQTTSCYALWSLGYNSSFHDTAFNIDTSVNTTHETEIHY